MKSFFVDLRDAMIDGIRVLAAHEQLVEDRLDAEEVARRMADGQETLSYDEVRKELNL